MKKINLKGCNETLYKEKLDNGLEIYMVPNNKVKNFYITLNVKFGSIYTNYSLNGKSYKMPKGLAHYLEHLMFNMKDGTAFDYFGKMGSRANAYTSYDITCYEVFANSNFKENLSYLLKYVYTPYFTKELVDNERGIITEEVKMYGDNPNSELLYGLFRNIFVNDEYQYLISGTTSDVKKITVDDVLNSYNAFYHPENMFLVITGNFNPEETIAITTDVLTKFKFKEYIKPVLNPVKEPNNVKKTEVRKKMNVDNYKVNIGIKIPKSNFKSLKLKPEEIKVYLNLIMRLNFGFTSLIQEELKTNQIVTEDISYGMQEVKDYYILFIIGYTPYPDYFIKRIKEKLDNLEIIEEDIKRKIKSSISSYIMMFDDIESVSSDISDDVINYGDYLTNVYDLYKNLNIEIAEKVKNKIKVYSTSTFIIEPN